jgi:hypothetical protein
MSGTSSEIVSVYADGGAVLRATYVTVAARGPRVIPFQYCSNCTNFKRLVMHAHVTGFRDDAIITPLANVRQDFWTKGWKLLPSHRQALTGPYVS